MRSSVMHLAVLTQCMQSMSDGWNCCVLYHVFNSGLQLW